MCKRTMRVMLAVSAVLAGGAAAADMIATGAGKALLQSRFRVLDTRAARQYEFSERLRPKQSGFRPYDGGYGGEYLEMARAAALRHGVPVDLFLRLVEHESGWDPRAKSTKGALGLAQLMPETARQLGVDPLDPWQNLDGGARYLAQQFRRFRSWRLALAAYNAGPDAVAASGGVPPYRETRAYVRAIWGG